MKKITAILAASLASLSIASAQSTASGPELSISSTIGWESEYIFRGRQVAEEYFSPAVDVSYGDFYAGIWTALPVDSKLASIDSEVDFYAGYGFGLGEIVSADVGFTYYTYPGMEDDFFDTNPNSLEGYAGLSFEVPLSPAIYVFYDFEWETLTVELSGGHSIEVSDKASVDFSGWLGYVSPDDSYGWDKGDYIYYGVGVAYTYKFTDNASVSVGLNWYAADQDYIGEHWNKSNQLAFSTSFTAGF